LTSLIRGSTAPSLPRLDHVLAQMSLASLWQKFSVKCPYSYQKRRVSYYFRQVNGKPPSDPICALDVTDTLATMNQLKRGCMTLGRNIDHQNLAATGVEGDPIPDGIINHITPKRKPCINDQDCAAASAITPGNDDCPILKVGCLVGSDD
jgi:hypothetical protein